MFDGCIVCACKLNKTQNISIVNKENFQRCIHTHIAVLIKNYNYFVKQILLSGGIYLQPC
jgi:hypothetical protein